MAPGLAPDTGQGGDRSDVGANLAGMADLYPLPLRDNAVRRVAQLLLGLALFTLGEALIVDAGLGVLPWDVLGQGLVRHFGLTLGTWSVIVSVLVLLAWIPLRERPGLGTLANALLIGVMLDPFMRWLPDTELGWVRGLALVGGVALNGLGSAVYIGSRLGPGPRDGVMTALVRLTGRSVRVVRTCIEVVVVAVGFLLGGNLGIGTLLYALAIGPSIHFFLPSVLYGGPGATAAPRVMTPDDDADRGD